MSKVIDHEHRYTEEEEDYLRSRAQEHLIAINHRVFPEEGDDEEPTGTPQSIANDLGTGGEGETGHVVKSTIGDQQVSGFDDAPDDVKSEVEPMTATQIKEELDALGVEYPGNASKAELRDILAKEWSKT